MGCGRALPAPRFVPRPRLHHPGKELGAIPHPGGVSRLSGANSPPRARRRVFGAGIPPGWLPRGRNKHKASLPAALPTAAPPFGVTSCSPQLLGCPKSRARLIEKPLSFSPRKSQGGNWWRKAGSGDAAAPLPWLREGEVGTPLGPPFQHLETCREPMGK